MGEWPVRRSALVILVAVLCLAACDPVATEDVPRPTVPSGNVADRLVRITLDASSLQPPYEVVEIRQGALDELSGLTPEAEAAASIPPFATGRRSLIRQAWRVRIIGSTCTDDPCTGVRTMVEAFIDASDERIISVRTSPVLPSPAASTSSPS